MIIGTYGEGKRGACCMCATVLGVAQYSPQFKNQEMYCWGIVENKLNYIFYVSRWLIYSWNKAFSVNFFDSPTSKH